MDMAAWLAAIGGKLEQSSFGDWVRVTPYLYPVLESLHILGIAMLVGSALAVDLRLLGVGRACPAGDHRGALPPTAIASRLRGRGSDWWGDVHRHCCIGDHQRGRSLEVRAHRCRGTKHRCLPHWRLSLGRGVGSRFPDTAAGTGCRPGVGAVLDRCYRCRTLPGVLTGCAIANPSCACPYDPGQPVSEINRDPFGT
jgi:hypothetical protein